MVSLTTTQRDLLRQLLAAEHPASTASLARAWWPPPRLRSSISISSGAKRVNGKSTAYGYTIARGLIQYHRVGPTASAR